MYNLYIEEKNQNNLSKKVNEEKKNILDIQKHKKSTDNLFLKYQKRIKQFIIDVSFNIFNIL
jgi:hypothetical protein